MDFDPEKKVTLEELNRDVEPVKEAVEYFRGVFSVEELHEVDIAEPSQSASKEASSFWSAEAGNEKKQELHGH